MAPFLSHKRQVVIQLGICLPELWVRQLGRDNPGEAQALCSLHELAVAVGGGIVRLLQPSESSSMFYCRYP